MKTSNQLILACMLIFTSCSTVKREMAGNFSGVYRWGFRPNDTMELSLNNDSTFIINLKRRFTNAKDTFSGHWCDHGDRNIVLNFNPPSLIRLLSSPLLNTEQRTIRFLGRNKLKYDDDTILKRTK